MFAELDAEKFLSKAHSPLFICGFIILNILERVARNYFIGPMKRKSYESNMPAGKPFGEPPIKNFVDLQNLFKSTLKVGYFIPFISFYIPTIRISPYTFFLTLIVQFAANRKAYMKRVANFIYPLTVTIETYETTAFWFQYFISNMLRFYNSRGIFTVQTGIEIALHLFPLIILYALSEQNNVVLKFSLLHIPILVLVAMLYGVNCCKVTLTVNFFNFSLSSYYTELIASILYLTSLLPIYFIVLNLIDVSLISNFFKKLIRLPFMRLSRRRNETLVFE